MCLNFLVAFVLLCYHVLSGTPEIGKFWPTPPGVEVPPPTWLDADFEIATRPGIGFVDVSPPKGTGVAGKAPRGRWDRAWWYATSESSEDNTAQWRQAKHLLIDKFKEVKKAARTAVVTPHVFVGIKLMINSFAYDEDKKAYRLRGEAYPPYGTLPRGWTLLWSNGQAPVKEIELDAKTPVQTRILKQALSRKQTHAAVRSVMQKEAYYHKTVLDLKSHVQMMINRKETAIGARKIKCAESGSGEMREKCEEPLDEEFKKYEKQIKAKEAQELDKITKNPPTLGFVMFMERIIKESGSPAWQPRYKFMPIDEPFDDEGKSLSLFVVQALETTERAPPEVAPGKMIRKIDPLTGKRYEAINYGKPKGPIPPGTVVRKSTAISPLLPPSGSKKKAKTKEKSATGVTAPYKRGISRSSGASESEFKFKSPEEAKEEEARRTAAELKRQAEEDRKRREAEKEGEVSWVAVEEPSPERYPRYPLHYAHNDGYGYVNNTKESKSPTMIILMITMCIMTAICCGCAIIAAECYCVGKAHGKMNKETMEEEDAILRLQHMQNCI